ncbi:MAG: 4-hydroxy-tetrahydrodipicolinate reductase [Chloroflexi bacterium RBG_16_68_14]|nr:MAG: 4-hydroxy-tetrahydrodipicolinate reductase [Chloroflexi bacterium RBG_16_68_14]
MTIRVVVSGTGNMGRQVLAAVAREADLEPVGVLEKFSTEEEIALPGGGSVPMSADPEALLDGTKPDVVIDFTNAEWTPQMARAALERGVRLVIGTTGLPDGWLDELEAQCRERGVGAVVAANFAIGAVLMIYLAKVAGRFFDAAEIIELHHDRKVDAPSGTALTTAREILSARGRPFQRNVPDKETLAGTRAGEIGGITIHSVRLPGLVAHQEVIFGGLGQTLTIRHDTTGRESFIPGVLLATREVMRRRELVRGLEALVGLS